MPEAITNILTTAEEHIDAALTTLGFDTKHASTKDTPYRIAKYWHWLLSETDAPRYTTEKAYDPTTHIKLASYEAPSEPHLVTIRDIRFISACEHHFLPVFGHCSIGYIPNKKIIGLSKFARIVRHFSHKPTTQEHSTEEIGNHLLEILDPSFLAIHIEATHTCMSCRGVEETASKTITSFFHPSDQDTTKQEFYRNLRQYG